MFKILKLIIQFLKNLFNFFKKKNITKSLIGIEARRFPRNPRHYLNGLLMKNSYK